MQLSATRVSAGASAGGPSLEARALAAIRRSGGWLHGIPASGSGVFTDSNGVTAAAATGDVLGLVLDGAYGQNNIGATELVTNGTFAGLTGWTSVIGTAQVVGGRARVIRPDNNSIGRLSSSALACTPGRTYRLTIERYNGTSGGGEVVVSNNFSSVGQGTLLNNFSVIEGLFTAYFTATQVNHWIFLQTRNGAAIGDFCEHDNVSVREVFGVSATQPTQASKPIIGTLSNNRRAMRFDGATSGSDFLALPPAAVFNPHADHWAIAAFVKMGGDGLGQVLCGSSNTGNNNSLACQLFLDTTNTVRAIWRTDAGTSATVSTVGTVAIGSPTVVTAQRTSNTGTLRLNGVSVGTPQALPTSGITVNTANIGLSVRPVNASPLNGFAIVAAGNGTLQDTDRALIERYLAQQIGASLGA